MPLQANLYAHGDTRSMLATTRNLQKFQNHIGEKMMNKHEPYSERVKLRLSEEDKRQIQIKAEQANMNVSDYLRALINNKRIVVAPDLPKIAVQIIKIGVNVSQICNIAKDCGTVSPEIIQETEQQLTAVKDKLSELIKEVHEKKDRTKYKECAAVGRMSQVEVNAIVKETLRRQFDNFFKRWCRDLVKGSPSEKEQAQHELNGMLMFCGSLQALTEQEEQEVKQCIMMKK